MRKRLGEIKDRIGAVCSGTFAPKAESVAGQPPKVEPAMKKRSMTMHSIVRKTLASATACLLGGIREDALALLSGVSADLDFAEVNTSFGNPLLCDEVITRGYAARRLGSPHEQDLGKEDGAR